MIAEVSSEEPPERRARSTQGRATFELLPLLSPRDPVVRSTLAGWLGAAEALAARPLSRRTRLKLDDCRRIGGELLRVLSGEEPGEGTSDARRVLAVSARGRIQALTSAFLCPRATFVELLVAAPWNLLAAEDPPDLRAARGAGAALLAALVERSRARGGGGRLALLAENPRSRERYERLGFRRMDPADRPLTLVPPGGAGFSPSILRLAAGSPGPEEERSPWMLLEPPAARPWRSLDPELRAV